MKAVILAGGLGSRLSEETVLRPKPMVEIGGKPILWHIMKLYAAHGVNEFVLAVGYKGEVIKEYFLNYYDPQGQSREVEDPYRGYRAGNADRRAAQATRIVARRR